MAKNKGAKGARTFKLEANHPHAKAIEVLAKSGSPKASVSSENYPKPKKIRLHSGEILTDEGNGDIHD